MENQIHIATEKWKEVIGWEYYISALGRVWSLKSHRLLTPWVSTFGYKQVKLYQKGVGKKTYSVHQLVLTAFGPEKPGDEFEANHKDGDKTNNQIDNLEWVTKTENSLHAHRTGLHPKKHRPHVKPAHWSKLSSETVDQIKSARASGMKCKEASRLFKITTGYVSKIATGRYTVRWPKLSIVETGG